MPSLSLIRHHLHIDHDGDDEILQHYADAARAWIESYTGVSYDPENALMRQAALLLIGASYESREAIIFASVYQLPYGVIDLLSGLKRQVVGHDEGATNA